MTGRIPWPRVAVEGVVIVGSILLAFGIDAWWSDRQAEELEAAMSAAAYEEVAANQSALVSQLELSEYSLARIDRFLRATPRVLAQVPGDSVFATLSGFGRAEDFEPITGAALTFLQSPAASLAQASARGSVNRWVQALEKAEVERAVLQRRQESVQTEMVRYATGNAQAGAANFARMVSRSGPTVLVEMRNDDRVLSAVIEKAVSHMAYALDLAALLALSDSVMAALVDPDDLR